MDLRWGLVLIHNHLLTIPEAKIEVSNLYRDSGSRLKDGLGLSTQQRIIRLTAPQWEGSRIVSNLNAGWMISSLVGEYLEWKYELYNNQFTLKDLHVKKT